MPKKKKEKKEKAKQAIPRVNREWCKGCGICAAFCPKKVLEIDDMQKSSVVRPDDCIDCGLCELRCPDMAIEIIREDENG